MEAHKRRLVAWQFNAAAQPPIVPRAFLDASGQNTGDPVAVVACFGANQPNFELFKAD
jgi:hypothetical protein